jgi:hypothetical protein
MSHAKYHTAIAEGAAQNFDARRAIKKSLARAEPVGACGNEMGLRLVCRGVLDGADNRHQGRASDGRAANVTHHAAATTWQHSHGRHDLLPNATADQVPDCVSNRSETEFLQQSSGDIAVDSATNQSND